MNKGTIIKSLIFKTVERFSVKGLGFVISILLARMLSPEVFGQIALITVVINLSQSIIEGGLGTALVQNKDVDDRDYSTVFYICMAMSVVIAAVVFAGAPLLANYYKSPEMLLPLRVYIFSVFFNSYASILTARMQREMRFKQIMYCSLTATCVSGALAVALAFSGAGIWTLVVYYFSHTLVNCIAMFAAVRWFPRLTFSVTRARVLYGFGWKMLASSLLCSLYADLRSLIIGKRFSTEALGYYDRGNQIPFVISSAIDSSVQSVMFPVIAKAQEDQSEAAALLRRSLMLSALLVLPAMMGLAAISDTFIRLLLTEKWLPCVPYMQIFCVCYAFYPLHTANLNAIKAMGRSDMFLILEVIKKAIGLLALVITMRMGVLYMALSRIFTGVLAQIINAWPNSRLLNYSYPQQLRDMLPAIALSAVMGLLVYTLNFLGLGDFVTLVLQVLAGVGIYVLGSLLFKLDSFRYILSILKNLLRRNGAAKE